MTVPNGGDPDSRISTRAITSHASAGCFGARRQVRRCASGSSSPLTGTPLSATYQLDQRRRDETRCRPDSAVISSASRIHRRHKSVNTSHARLSSVADPDRGGGRLRLGCGDRRARLPRRSGPRSAGTATASSSRSAATRMKRAVWYFAATLPDRMRQALPAGASHLGHGWRSTACQLHAGSLSELPVRTG